MTDPPVQGPNIHHGVLEGSTYTCIPMLNSTWTDVTRNINTLLGLPTNYIGEIVISIRGMHLNSSVAN